MKVAIVSDTHYAVDRFRKLLRHLKEINVTHLIHAGDYDGSEVENIICDEKSINFFIALGNCDHNWQKNNLLEKQAHVLIGDVLSFELQGVSFGVAHIPGEAQQVLKKEEIQIFIYGHTHKKKIVPFSNGLIVNPGSLMDNGSYLLMELPSLDISDHYVETE